MGMSTVGWTLVTILVALVASFSTALAPVALARLRRRSAIATTRADIGARSSPKSPLQAVSRLRPAIPEKELRSTAAGPSFYLTSLMLDSIRCFESVQLELRFPGEPGRQHLRHTNVNVLLGINGSGKSTVLRSAAVAALGPALESSRFVPYEMVRQREPVGLVAGAFALGVGDTFLAVQNEVTLTRSIDVEVVRTRNNDDVWNGVHAASSAEFFVAGYGPNRRVAEDAKLDPSAEGSRRDRRFGRVAGLFEESTVLASFGGWLPQANSRHRGEVEELLNGLLPTGTSFTGRFRGSEPLFNQRDLEIPFRALSDGFRSYLGWLGDLLFQLSAVAGDTLELRDVGGVVLVDEVDLLLHPSWQRIVVPTVSRLLPSMQFIFTTHSPIVAGTVEPENILVARISAETGESEIVRLDEQIHGRNADQVLLSSYFDLETTRADDAVDRLESLASSAVRGDEDSIVAYLHALPKVLTQAGRHPGGKRDCLFLRPRRANCADTTDESDVDGARGTTDCCQRGSSRRRRHDESVVRDQGRPSRSAARQVRLL